MQNPHKNSAVHQDRHLPDKPDTPDTPDTPDNPETKAFPHIAFFYFSQLPLSIKICYNTHGEK